MFHVFCHNVMHYQFYSLLFLHWTDSECTKMAIKRSLQVFCVVVLAFLAGCSSSIFLTHQLLVLLIVKPEWFRELHDQSICTVVVYLTVNAVERFTQFASFMFNLIKYFASFMFKFLYIKYFFTITFKFVISSEQIATL